MAIYMWRDVASPWIYRSSTLGLISLVDNDWNVTTIADKNLWATSTDISSTNSYWYYYQWWNNYWFPTTWSVTTSSSAVSAAWYWPWNYYNSSTWITATQRDSSTNLNLWWGTTWTVEDMKWPCNTWYHIPNNTELSWLLTMWQTITWKTASNISDFSIHLKIPFAWYRNRSNWAVTADWGAIWLWASDASWTSAYYMYWTSNWSTILNVSLGNKWFGYNIRPFKNYTVMPDSSWDVIYQPEWLMSFDEIYALLSQSSTAAWYAELNSHPTEYYNKFNSEWHLTLTYETYLRWFATNIHPDTMYNTWSSSISQIAPWTRWPY